MAETASSPLSALTNSTGPDYSQVVDQNIWQPLQSQTAASAQLPSLVSQMGQMPSALTPIPLTPVMPPMGRPAVQARGGGGGGGGGISATAGGSYQGNAQGAALLRDAAAKAGFSGSALDTMVAIGMAESGGNPRNLNNNPGTGDLSYGLWQINMLGGMGPERRAQYGLSSNDQLFDPYTNARVAYAMSGGGKNFSPWSTYKSGAYRRFE